MTKYKEENKLQKISSTSEQGKPVISETQSIIIMDNRMPNNSSEKEKNEKKHPVVVLGSNNIIGHNIFLVNTNSEQESKDIFN